jgi:Polyprenyl synthetase
VTGKIGTDIEDNKCSWLIVQALSRASVEQRALLEVFYLRLMNFNLQNYIYIEQIRAPCCSSFFSVAPLDSVCVAKQLGRGLRKEKCFSKLCIKVVKFSAEIMV